MKTFVLATVFYFASSLLTAYAFAQPVSPIAARICGSYNSLSNQNACLTRLGGKKLDKDVPRICEHYNQANNREICATSLAGVNIADGVVQICEHYNQANNVQACAIALKNVVYLDSYAIAGCETYNQANNVQVCALDLANREYDPVYAERCFQKYNQANNRQACLKPLGTEGLRTQAASVNTCDEYLQFAAKLRAEFNADDEMNAELIRDLLTKLNAKFAICTIGVLPSAGAVIDSSAAGIN